MRRYSNDKLLALFRATPPLHPLKSAYMDEMRRRVEADPALVEQDGIFVDTVGTKSKRPPAGQGPAAQRSREKRLEEKRLQWSRSKRSRVDWYLNTRKDQNDRRITEVGPVWAYIGTDDAVTALQFYREVSSLLKKLGLEHEIEHVERGSIYLNFKAWLRKGETKAALKRQLEDLQDHAEMMAKAHAHRVPAEVDNINSGTITGILASAGDSDVCIVLAQVYVLRGRRPDGTAFVTGGQLSAQQASYIEKRPLLKGNPWMLLNYLEQGVELEAMVERPQIEEGQIVESHIDGSSTEATG